VFRIGADGSIPLPTSPAASVPFVPSTPFGELLAFNLDPENKVGRTYAFDFTVQRELPRNLLFEVGWIGRWSRNSALNVSLNASPYFFVDSASRQSFAEAFDAVATALRAGQTPGTQPRFEN